MDFAHSERSQALQAEVAGFLDSHVYPAEHTFEAQAAANRAAGNPFRTPEVLAGLKDEARRRGLWNLFLPDDKHGAGLAVLEYAPIAELSGRAPHIAPESMNCSAPDTGNMELLAMFASEAQTTQWLEPLLRGEIRSCFSMTEPAVASSDATNIATTITPDGDSYVVERPQVVVHRRAAARVQGRDRHGRQRPGGREVRAALDDPRSARHARASRSSVRRACSATTTARTAGTA